MLITPAYREQNRGLYAVSEKYGTSSAKIAPMARPLADWGRLPLLDYGCGRQLLARTLGPAYRVTPYDPCIDGLDSPPEPHPVVVCSEVLEHVEPECIDAVMADLRRVTLQRGLLTISLAPAKKTLPDGRNAHLLLQSKEWWFDKMKEHGFEIVAHGDGLNGDKPVAMWTEVRPC